MPCLFFYALLNAYRLILVVVAVGLGGGRVLVVDAAGWRVVVVRCTVVVLPVLSVCLIVVRVVPSFFTRLSIVVCTVGLRVALEVVVVLVPLLVCSRSCPAFRTLTPEPLADTRLSNAYSGCC